MTRDVVDAKRGIQPRSKVKTGCITCRIRKIKCDKGKPSCHKCSSTGRTCDGYESPFRLINGLPVKNTRTYGYGSSVTLQSIQISSDEIAPEDVESLNHALSTKTIFDGVRLDCNEEVKQVLQASLTNPSVRHAVLSLKALRKDLEAPQGGLPFVVQQDPSYTYGTQQYSMALKGLASNLSSLDSLGVRSALLCCQIFISIEQVQGNYSAMARHMIGGLKIMYEHRRIQFVKSASETLKKDEQLPLLDVFLVKLFAAPCKFEDQPAKDQAYKTVSLKHSAMHHQDPNKQYTLRPNMRTELTKIAVLTVEFLTNVSRIEPAADISLLLLEKDKLLGSLKAWIDDFESIRDSLANPEPEVLSISFMRLFHAVLKVVLLGALEFLDHSHNMLQLENDCLQNIADDIGKRIKSYRS